MKARIKNFEDMPERVKCCPETIVAMQSHVGTIIEVEEIPFFFFEQECVRCGARYTGKAFKYKGHSWWSMFADCIDLDEGEIHEN